jgi:N-acetylmuramoyl-L-alanine amidase
MKRVLIGFLIVLVTATALLYTRKLAAADTDFLIYFENSTLALKSQTVERTPYLPLLEIVRHLGLAFTDATGSLTFTIQGQNSRLVLTPGAAFVSYNDQPVLLQNPVRRENGQWLIPLDFLSQGLSRVAGIEFRYRPGSRRVFAGKVMTTELAMNAQSLGALTRLTLRSGAAIDVELHRESQQHRAILTLKGKALDPVRERLDYKDTLVQSVAFEDSDGSPRLIVGVADDTRDIRISASEENRVHFIDFIRGTATETTTPVTPAPTAPGPAAARPNGNGSTLTNVRVIAIDAGHGGMETGATNAGTLEKELTLALARRLRTALQSRLAATVVLTRDSDVALTGEARVAVANTNQANLFVSLHTGYSPEKTASGSSIYIMKSDFTGGTPEPPGGRLFLPWYMGYRLSGSSSQALATALQKDLNQALPGWKFPIRQAPIGVLASATMPAVAIEIGNLNNDVSVKTLTDVEFQTKLAGTIAAGIEQYAIAHAGNRKP